MKKMLFLAASLFIGALAFQSCTSSDQKIQNEVQKVVSNDYRSVNSTVNNGVVTLTGTVESQQTRSAAESAARSVKNVKSVVNNIAVNSTTNPQQGTMYPDDSMRSTISSRLNSAGYRDVRVDVNNGEVTLSGDLNRSDLTRVMQIANESNPRRVVNNMTLR